jgi:hypothetical protein
VTRGVDLVWVILAVLATVIGVWLGLAGAEVSPIFTEVTSGVGPGPSR